MITWRAAEEELRIDKVGLKRGCETHMSVADERIRLVEGGRI